MGGLLVIISVLITTTLLCCQACSKVVRTHTQYTATNGTQHTHTHGTYSANLYLPPTDYKRKYQRDVLGTDCWKTLVCEKRSNGNTTYYRPGNFLWQANITLQCCRLTRHFHCDTVITRPSNSGGCNPHTVLQSRV